MSATRLKYHQTMDPATRRVIRRQKTTYKRRTIIFIWAIFITYFSFSYGPSVPSVTAAPANELVKPSSNIAVVPSSSFLRLSRNIRSANIDTEDFNNDNDYGDLVEGVNCTPPAIADFPPDLFTQEERANGAVVIHFLASLYIFYCVALVCDDFFVPSIECICEDLHLPSDVGGATFMAIATSAPELFTNVVGTFITKGDIGLGTIVGSAVFNILAVGACCGLAANRALPLEWWPLTRDCLFYSLSVVLLIIVQLNRQVYWYEALSLVLLYIVYIGMMCKNTYLKEAAEKFVHGIIHGRKGKHKKGSSLSIRGITPPAHVLASTERTPLIDEKQSNAVADNVGSTNPKYDSTSSYYNSPAPISIPTLERSSEKNGGVVVASSLENSGPRGYSEQGEANEEQDDSSDDYEEKQQHTRLLETGRKVSVEEYDELMISQALQKSVAHAKEEEEEGGLFILPRGASIIEWFEWIAGWPIRFCLTITMPDCRQQKFRSWYPLTFFMCILWIGALSYIVSWMMTVIGHTLHIPDSVMGLTFIAAGTSVPEAVSSIIVARQGLGSMGISNSIGSNTFDILICLGMPWLIRGSIIANDEINYIQINSNGFGYATIMLIASLVLLYALLACNGFVLDKKTGIIALIMYGIFLIIATLTELNVFFPNANLPSCPTDL